MGVSLRPAAGRPEHAQRRGRRDRLGGSKRRLLPHAGPEEAVSLKRDNITLPPLVRAHLSDFGRARSGLVFTGVYGDELASVTYRRVCDNARRQALTPAEYASPRARRVYDLRHACVSTWLNAGVRPVQIAEWAGHSAAVLLKIYAKCIDDQDHINRRRIEDALGDFETPDDEARDDKPEEGE